MGLTFVQALVKATKRSRRVARVNFLVDSGAQFSLVKATTLAGLGVTPDKEETFFLADGTAIRRRMGEAFIAYLGHGVTTQVIFGEDKDEPLLGVLTLEQLGLVLDPFKREIRPMARLMLAESTRGVRRRGAR